MPDVGDGVTVTYETSAAGFESLPQAEIETTATTAATAANVFFTSGIVSRMPDIPFRVGRLGHFADDEKVLVETGSNLSPDRPVYGSVAEQGAWFITEPGFYKVVGQRNVDVNRWSGVELTSVDQPTVDA